MSVGLPPQRKVAWSIYALGLSLVATILLTGYVLLSDRENDRKLAEVSLARQEDSNLFFEEVCDRFALRDEIFLSILQSAYGRALESGEQVVAESLLSSIVALREAQGNCRRQIPKVRKPPSAP
jgi:hypothetical protein